jgi:hypothetical protein
VRPARAPLRRHPTKYEEPDALLGALALGGGIIIDDLTPEEQRPAAWHDRRDPVRNFWLNDPRLIAAAIRTTATTAVIIAPCVTVAPAANRRQRPPRPG